MRSDGVTGPERAVSPWRGFWLGVCAAAAVAATLALASAVRGADEAAPSPFSPASLFHRGPRDRASMRAHLGVAVAWALRGAGASDDQQQRVGAILQGALAELDPLGDRRRANHQALIAALSAPSVDRAAIEAARAEEVALFEEASLHVASALGDAADALTQEQRAALAKLAADMHD
jgi:Spy/CpxP family protein refolding chaperone